MNGFIFALGFALLISPFLKSCALPCSPYKPNHYYYVKVMRNMSFDAFLLYVMVPILSDLLKWYTENIPIGITHGEGVPVKFS